MTPLTVPLAVKVVMAIGLLLALNEIAPGVPETVLVLVALYLVLTQSRPIAALVSNATGSFNEALARTRPPTPGGVRTHRPLPTYGGI